MEKQKTATTAARVERIVMPHLQQSQLEFEVARDIVTLMKAMKRGDSVTIQIDSTGGYYDWRCSGDNQPCGPSEASRAMRQGYDRIFMRGKRCECHERDSSYVCNFCYAQGHRGHMQS